MSSGATRGFGLVMAVVCLSGCAGEGGVVMPRPPGTCGSDADCGSGRCVAGRCEAPAMLPSQGGRQLVQCTDLDLDGYGTGCAAGLDCDDGDEHRGGAERCDGHDNDCDGMIDELDGATSALCTICDPGCSGAASGVGTSAPFSIDMGDGIALDPEGALVLGSQRIDTNFIWVANTGEGTVSKVDTRTFTELARYRTGPGGAAEDPSRTSVNTLGDVYVGNRGGMSLTKISVLGAGCADRNGDGVVTTSTGASDLLAWEQDDCVLWRTELPGGGVIRAVAAQDLVGPDGEIESFVWVGGWDGFVWKLDGATGAILLRTASPTKTYGFALDARGNLWISGRESAALGRIDTTRCLDEASCGTEICGAEGDTCVKQAIPAPSEVGGEHYGITVDAEQRVWVAYYNGYVGRYDPLAPIGARYVTVRTDAVMRGIAADASGFVWAAGMEAGVFRFDADDPTRFQVVPGTEGFGPIGMAVDLDGKVWAINYGHGHATVITPGPTLADATVAAGVAPGFVSPYTYSDMTGTQLRLATTPRGTWRRVFEGCDASSVGTTWRTLAYDIESPPGTRVLVRARTGNDAASLAAASFVVIAEVPGSMSPVEIGDRLGAMHGSLLELEVQLSSTHTVGSSSITPRVRSVEVVKSCSDLLE